ncbi:MAG TPA: glycosyltransferase family 39 protein [Sandaracinaceae bacterium]
MNGAPHRSRHLAVLGALGAWAAIAFAAWLAMDAYARHGLSVRWQTVERGRLIDVARTTEHRIQFPTQHRALSRIVEAWDYEAHGVPRSMPHMRATLRGKLENTRPIRVRAVSPNEVTLTVDGAPAEGFVEPGEHDLRVVWDGQFRDPNRQRSSVTLRLEQSFDGAAWEELSTWSVRPAYGHWDRVWAACIALFVFVVIAVPLARAMLADGAVRRRWLGATALVAILLVGLGFRLFDYSVMPHFRENGDELFATWNGWQLLTDGTTRGWSLWPSFYTEGVEHESFPYWTTEGGGWHIIRPYFEHPPLSHLLAGLAAKLGGATHWAHARLTHTRLVPIFLSLVTMALTFLVGRRLSPRGPGPWLGVLLYATLPMIAIQNRAIKEEMLLAPMALGSLYLFLRWRDGASDRALIGAAFLAGLTSMAKVSGAVLVPALVLLVMATGRYRMAARAFVAGLAGIAVLFVYGALIDWDVFIVTTLKQATGRPAHFNLFPRFFADGLIIHNLVGHGPTLFLWLGYVAYLGGRGRRVDPAWVLYPLVYLVSMCVSAGNWMFGWYVLPVYPFLCLAAGEMLAELFERPHPLGALVLVGLLAMYGLNFVADPSYFKQPHVWPTARAWVSALVVVLLGPHFAAFAIRWRGLLWLARGATAAALALSVVMSGYFVARYDVLWETHHDFDRDTFFDR